jgi:hypothetical protein
MVQSSEIRLMTEKVFIDKATEQDGILADYVRRVQSVEVLGGLAPGDVSDATMADIAANPATGFAGTQRDLFVERGKDRLRIPAQPLQGGNDTAGIQALINTAKTQGRDVYLRDNTYNVSNLVLDYTADAAVNLGFKAPRFGGGSKRNTIIKQIAGSTGPVINVIGQASTPSHTGKVTGFLLEHLTVVGTSTGSDGIRMRSFTDAAIRDFWVQGCGRHGIALDRAQFNVGVADEYAYGLQIQNGKSLLNAGLGIACIGQHPIGPALLSGVELESNTQGGLLAYPSSFTLEECYIGGNGGPGVVTSYAPGSLNAYGFRMFGGRLEGNTGYEIDLQGGHSALLEGVIILASTGAHGVRIGGGDPAVNDAQLVGNFFAGDKVTVGQKALIITAKATGTQVHSPRFEVNEFKDYVNDITDLYTNAGADTYIRHRAHMRTAQSVMVANAGSDRAYESRQKGDVFRRWSARADGFLQWGGGTVAPDVDMYRDNLNRITMGAGDSFKVDGTWNGGRYYLGTNQLWVDATGKLRIKNGNPTSDTDGSVVGGQA